MQSIFIKNRRNHTNLTTTWEQRELGECFDERTERSADGELIAVTINSGVVKASELNRHDNSSEDKSNYKVVRVNDIAYNSMRMWQGASGYSQYDGILSPAYTVVIPRENVNPVFFSYMFKRTDMIHEFQINSQGLTSDTWNLKFPAFSTISANVPKSEEQQAIGNYFTNLDNLITLHQRKYSLLFIRTFEILKEVCFFLNVNAWEQRELKSITSVITKGTTPLDKSNSGVVNFIKVENIDNSSGEISISQKISIEEHEGYLKRSQLQENDILFSIAGTLGRVTSVNSDILPANTNQALAIIRLKECNLDYIKTFLKSKAVTDYIRRNPTVGAQPNLSLEQVGNLEIQVPSLREQEAIGNYFKSFDHLITLHQRKPFQRKNGGKNYVRRC